MTASQKSASIFQRKQVPSVYLSSPSESALGRTFDCTSGRVWPVRQSVELVSGSVDWESEKCQYLPEKTSSVGVFEFSVRICARLCLQVRMRTRLAGQTVSRVSYQVVRLRVRKVPVSSSENKFRRCI